MELALSLRNESISEVVHVARLAEDLGYRQLWIPDGARGAGIDAQGRLTGRDAFCSFAAMFAATTTLRGAIGVAATPMHTLPSLALTASTLTEQSGGRFELGLGVSHRELADRNGVVFPDRPIEFMRNATRELRRLSDGHMAFGNHWPVSVAALGPKMVDVAIEEASGVVLNWLTPAAAAAAVQRCRTHSSDPTRAILYVRLMTTDMARQDAIAYDALANYHRHFVAQDLLTPDAIVAHTTLPADDLGACRERITRYGEAGIDELCLYPIGLDPGHRDGLLEALKS